MTPLSCRISYITLPALLLITMFCAESAAADSIIRIIGDRPTTSPNDSSGPMEAEPSSSSVKGSTTIRIIGDKQGTVQAPIKEIRIISDKVESVQKKTSTQSAEIETVEKKTNATTDVEKESLSKETAEQLLAQRLADLKRDEERKADEKAERERLAKVKAEQENEAARQEAIKQEQEKLAVRKAEESRRAAEKVERERLAKEKDAREKAAVEAARQAALKQEQERLAVESRKALEKAEQERIAALRADEERLAASKRAHVENPLPAIDAPSHQPEPARPSAVSLAAPDNHLNQDFNDDNKTGQAAATIWELYLSAKANDPALGRTEARVTGSKAESDVLMSTLLPHVDSTAGVKQISQTLTNYTTSDTSYDFTALNYNVTARMTLLHVPTIFSLSAAAAGLGVEQAGVAAARQNLIVKFTDAYFALLKAQADKQIALGEINRLKQVLDQSHAFLKVGTGDIIAVYEAQSRLDSAGADLTRSESTLRLAEQKLSTVVGKPVTSIMNYLPQQPTGPDPDNLDWWVATMEQEQPAVRQAREGVAQTAEQRKSVKAEYLPIVQASGGYDVNRGTAALPTAEVRQWFVGASISLPLYSGGETAAKVRRAVASEEERRHIFDETMDQQRENVKQAFFNLRYNISLIKALEQKKASAEIQLEAVSKGRKIGTRTAVDLLNAEQAYSVALRDYKYALYDNFIRVIQLKSAAGILVEADVSDVSREVAPTISSMLNTLAFRTSR